LIFSIGILVILAILVLRRPYLGVAITIASLPLTDILPPIPGASSVISLIGGVTLVGFLLATMRKRTSGEKTSLKLPASLILGLLFLIWLLSNFSAAMLPAPDGRVWIFTYAQLWALALLSYLLLDTPEQVYVLMWGFFLAGLVSAVYAGAEGVIGETVKTSVRAEGLASGANGAARYFLIALMFGYFLLTQQKKKVLQLFLIGGMIVILYGVFVTVSRTGLLLLITGISLLFLQNLGGKNRIYVFIFALLTFVIVWTAADNITSILQGISGSILAGTDTVGIRYGLWQAGLRMWADNPVAGVGVGQFSSELPFYGWDLLLPRYLVLGPHNMYIAVLSETGLVGSFFFLAMFILALRSLLQTVHTSDVPQVKELALTWMIILALILMAGVTKQDQYDKLTWMVVGVSAAISRMNA
jgi:O-antigen ligase